MAGGSNNAANQARRDEQTRQSSINNSVGRINQVFDDPARHGQIDDFYNATRQYYTDDLGRQKTSTDRNLKFAMARNGQTGGSVAVDANRRVGEDFLRGTVEADRKAQASAADLRTQDEQSRLNLIAMAQSGLDATTGASQATSALRNNLLSGKSTATAQGMGDAFSQFSSIYQRSQDEAATRRAQQYLYNALYQPGFGQGTGGP